MKKHFEEAKVKAGKWGHHVQIAHDAIAAQTTPTGRTLALWDAIKKNGDEMIAQGASPEELAYALKLMGDNANNLLDAIHNGV